MRDGGPAFPIANAIFNADASDSFEQFKAATSQSQGMSLRDYFAAAALQGAMANEKLLPSTENELSHLTMRSYELADAMIIERERERE